MGTRSLTFIHDGSDRIIVNIYRQMDGYEEEDRPTLIFKQADHE